MKKKEKIVKKLSDGTVAKVNTIVVVLKNDLCPDNAIVKLTATVKSNAVNKMGRYRNLSENDYILLANYNNENIFINADWTRKATPEERKQYYAELYARNK